jgi:hypothetical protein
MAKNSIADKDISLFKNVYGEPLQTISYGFYMGGITGGEWRQRVESYRKIPSNKAKDLMPCITTSGVFEKPTCDTSGIPEIVYSPSTE